MQVGFVCCVLFMIACYASYKFYKDVLKTTLKLKRDDAKNESMLIFLRLDFFVLHTIANNQY